MKVREDERGPEKKGTQRNNRAQATRNETGKKRRSAKPETRCTKEDRKMAEERRRFKKQ